MNQISLRHKPSMASIDQIFLNLLSLKSIESDCRQVLLRNKASFTDQLSDQMFIESYFRKNINRKYYKTILQQIVQKFKAWAQSILGKREGGKFEFDQGFAECDIFEQEFSELDGEEFDLDNVLL